MLSGAAQRRRGFALLAALVVIVAVMVVGSLVLGSSPVADDHDRVDRAHTLLTDLTDGTLQMTRFKADVGVYPATLRQLNVQITTADADLCGNTYRDRGQVVQTEEWGGPYLYRSLLAGGLPVGIGLARDTLERQPASGTPTAIIVVVDGVDARDARRLNTRVDVAETTAHATSGRVRWGGADAEGRVTLRWFMPVTEC